MTDTDGRNMPARLELEPYRPLMRQWARKAGSPPEDASDIVQDAMIKAIKSEEQLAGLGEMQLPAWLRKTTRRTALDAKRHREQAKRSQKRTRSLHDLGLEPIQGRIGPASPREAAEPRADDTSPSAGAVAGELRDHLLGQLTDDVRPIFTLILKEGWTLPEVAARLGLPESEVGKIVGLGLMQIGSIKKRLR